MPENWLNMTSSASMTLTRRMQVAALCKLWHSAVIVYSIFLVMESAITKLNEHKHEKSIFIHLVVYDWLHCDQQLRCLVHHRTVNIYCEEVSY